eukprot:CAMPEP_0113851260 /NCGR_PEP_ID=MMETSP0372-20130328/4490_1 /TAXON_ID=340204 /ORGANISM="Lankesteria abbotti" /LENGTH=161 /DNA_ID=CAMNT_0000821947 /DNA_START=942 /DNA_END=1424 /DNA_ORIENTATION=- /assembly_acc=CAM_ASM_000359
MFGDWIGTQTHRASNTHFDINELQSSKITLLVVFCDTGQSTENDDDDTCEDDNGGACSDDGTCDDNDDNDDDDDDDVGGIRSANGSSLRFVVHACTELFVLCIGIFVLCTGIFVLCTGIFVLCTGIFVLCTGIFVLCVGLRSGGRKLSRLKSNKSSVPCLD